MFVGTKVLRLALSFKAPFINNFKMKIVEMDEKVTILQQMEEKISPVILINKFNVKSEDVDKLIEAWKADASYFKQQPGFVSTQLHWGIGGSCVFINYAV